MTKLDHSRRNGRDLVTRRGADDVTDFGLPSGLNPPRPKPSKAAMRAQIAAAEARVARIVVCDCGHTASVAIPSSWVGRRALVCRHCGRRTRA